jgi:hypothetical protein
VLSKAFFPNDLLIAHLWAAFGLDRTQNPAEGWRGPTSIRVIAFVTLPLANAISSVRAAILT